MKKELQDKREIYIIILSFFTLSMLILGVAIFDYYKIKSIHNTSLDIYNHPLQVSNAALNVEKNIYAIQVHMKDVVRPQPKEKLSDLIQGINRHEDVIFKNLSIIKSYILGDEGLELQRQTALSIKNGKELRSELISLVLKGDIAQAVTIKQDKGVKHFARVENNVHKLYQYASSKALKFKNQSIIDFKDIELLTIVVNALFLIIFVLIANYTIERISKHIAKNRRLVSTLTVIRNINKLIVREDSMEKLTEHCCQTLTAYELFDTSWIIIFDSDYKVEHLTGTYSSENFIQFKKMVNDGWQPYCNHKTDKPYCHIQNTEKVCIECPLKNTYDNKSAFNIELKHQDRLYGYLNVATRDNYIPYIDIALLLEEVAGDISYAMHNIELNSKLKANEELYRYILEATTDGIWDRDLSNNQVYFSPRWKELLGYKDDELPSNFEAWKSRIHPDDKEQVFLDLEAAQKSDVQFYKNIHRLKHKDGHWVWIESRGQTIFDEDGVAIRILGSHTDITAQKEISDALKLSNQRYEATEKVGKVGSWEYDVKTQNFWGSNEAKEIYGLPIEQERFSADFLESCIPQRDLAHQALLDLIGKGSEYNLEIEIHPYDGSAPKIISSIAKLEDDRDGNPLKVIGFIQDITEKKQTLVLLEDKKREFETIIKEAPNPIMVHNEDGKVIMINRVWEELTGYSYDEIDTIDKWISLAHSNNKQEIKEHIDGLYKIKQTTKNREYELKTSSGDIIIWQFRTAPLGTIDGSRTVISSAMDITELKDKDRLLIVQSRYAAMGEMIAMIAHQWRQPISVISMDANNMLLDIELGSFDANISKEYANSMLKQTQHLSKTIDDFRSFFRKEKKISKVKLEDILNDTLSIVKDSLRNNTIELKINIETNKEIDAYPRELMQVFVNIINNSKDAIASNSIKDGLIEILIYEYDGYINTKICDNGGGIDEAIVAKIFDPYFSTKDEKTGTGLGLYMSKMIIENDFNGTIEAYSSDQGACFVVKLEETLKN